jgi:hypothetical protein
MMIIRSKYSIQIPPVDGCSYFFGTFEYHGVRFSYLRTKVLFLLTRLYHAKDRSIRLHKRRQSNTEIHKVRIGNCREENWAGPQESRRLA